MAKKQRDSGGGYNFMDTYGDLMTLLLTFFILLFSMSSVDSEKWEVLVRAFSKQDGANTAQIILIEAGDGTDVAPSVGEGNLEAFMVPEGVSELTEVETIELSQLAQAMQSYAEQNNMQNDVKIEAQGENSVYMSFNNDLFFDGDSYALRPTSFEILDYLGGLFKAVEDQVLVFRINGHTAEIPYVDNYNVNDWDLSAMRANRVATYFEEKTGLTPKKIITNGYGKNHPVASNDTEEGRAANRRVDIQILGNDFDKTDPQALLGILNQTLNVDLFDDTPIEETPVAPPEDLTAASSQAEDGVTELVLDTPLPEPVMDEPTEEEIQDALAALEKAAQKYNQ